MLKGLLGGKSYTNGNGKLAHSTGETAVPYVPPADGGRLIVLTAPLTETIDHAGYFIQMALASLPIWMEFVINDKYPTWRKVEHNPDGTARYMPAGVRLVEKSLLRESDGSAFSPMARSWSCRSITSWTARTRFSARPVVRSCPRPKAKI